MVGNSEYSFCGGDTSEGNKRSVWHYEVDIVLVPNCWNWCYGLFHTPLNPGTSEYKFTGVSILQNSFDFYSFGVRPSLLSIDLFLSIGEKGSGESSTLNLCPQFLTFLGLLFLLGEGEWWYSIVLRRTSIWRRRRYGSVFSPVIRWSRTYSIKVTAPGLNN